MGFASVWQEIMLKVKLKILKVVKQYTPSNIDQLFWNIIALKPF